MSPQQAIRSATGMDLKTLLTLMAMGSIMIGATVFVTDRDKVSAVQLAVNDNRITTLEQKFDKIEEKLDKVIAILNGRNTVP